MTKLRLHAYTPSDELALTITAPWFDKKKPRNWGMPANENFEVSTTYVEWRPEDDLFDFTPTGGNR